MRRFLLVLLTVACASVPTFAGRAGQGAAPAAFPLTVDSIMRGPDLLGEAPAGLRWSGDSSRLYFEWTKPGEDEASTYVVGRDGGEPRKLTDAERRLAPPPRGEWDRAHRRVLFAEDGDIAIVDSVAGTRIQLTRTTGREGSPRWARNETAVTFVRDGNLFIVPVQAGGDALVTQLTDISTKKAEPRLTDSQKYLKEEEAKLIEYTREQIEKKKEAEAKAAAEALPKLELADGQSAVDLRLSPDGVHVFVLVNQRARGARATEVPRYVTESAYVDEIPGRTDVGDAQSTRKLAILNLQTKKSVWADGAFAGEAPAKAGEATGKPAPREIDWGMPAISDDGAYAVGYARAFDNKDRWLVRLDPETGAARVVDHLHDDAWIREVRGFFGGNIAEFLPDNTHIWFISEKDGWAHLYTEDVSAPSPEAVQLTKGPWEVTAAALAPDRRHFLFVSTEVDPGERQVYTMALDGGPRTRLTTATGAHDPEMAPDGSMFGDVYSYSNKPPELYLVAAQPDAPMRQLTTTPTSEWRSFKWADPQVLTFKARDGVDVRARLYTPEMMGARRDRTHPGVVFVHGAGYLQNAHKYLVELLPRVHVPQPAGRARLRRARRGLPRELGLRARLADGHLPPHGRHGPRRHRGRREVPGDGAEGRPEAHRRLRRQLRRVHHPDGDVHLARHLRRRRRAPARDRLGALQPRLHVEHPQRAAERPQGLRAELAHLLRRRVEGRAADLPRHGGHQRALPGLRAPRAAADRAPEGELAARRVPGREPRVRARVELGGRVQAHPEAVRGQSAAEAVT